MNVLLIEDDETKRRNIVTYVKKLGENNITTSGSVNSSVRLLRQQTFDLVLCDMSLPTFDVKAGERGGRPQGFGGREIMRQMIRFEIKTPVIIITQYATFGGPYENMALEELATQLSTEQPTNYKGLVYYNSAFDTWKNDLDVLYNAIVGNE